MIQYTFLSEGILRYFYRNPNPSAVKQYNHYNNNYNNNFKMSNMKNMKIFVFA